MVFVLYLYMVLWLHSYMTQTPYRCVHFTRIVASNTANDDVTN